MEWAGERRINSHRERQRSLFVTVVHTFQLEPTFCSEYVKSHGMVHYDRPHLIRPSLCLLCASSSKRTDVAFAHPHTHILLTPVTNISFNKSDQSSHEFLVASASSHPVTFSVLGFFFGLRLPFTLFSLHHQTLLQNQLNHDNHQRPPNQNQRIHASNVSRQAKLLECGRGCHQSANRHGAGCCPHLPFHFLLHGQRLGCPSRSRKVLSGTG